MEIIKLTEDKYQEWDDFCLDSDDAWFWHTSDWLKYNLNYKSELKPESKSFIVLNNNEILAICPLILEKNNNVNEFSYGSECGPLPVFKNSLTAKTQKKIEKFVFKHIDDLAKKNSVKRMRFRFSILNKSFIETGKQKYNYLMKFNYIDNSINTLVIDLNKSERELRNNVRHGHDSAIDQSSKILKKEIFSQKNITLKLFEKYIDLHFKASSRSTRPRTTFDIMFDLIKQGKAFLVGAKKDGEFIGFSYFFLYKNNVYYGSSCNDPCVENISIAHFIQWKAICYMKSIKCMYYEIGWQNYSNTLSDFPSAKEINIGKFKRGFGGLTFPLFMAEKYYDKNYFLDIYKKRIEKYSDSMQ